MESPRSAPSDGAVTVLQIRTRAVLGLPKDYPHVELHVRSGLGGEELHSQSASRIGPAQAESGDVALEWWARFAPWSNDRTNATLEVKVMPKAPLGHAAWLWRMRARPLYAVLNPGADAHDAAEADEGRGTEGGGGKWRAAKLPLYHRSVRERIAANLERHRSMSRTAPTPSALQRNQSKQSTRAAEGAVAWLEIEYCLIQLPTMLSRYPELELLVPLARPLHSYAHGGFMGAALSLLSDPRWATVLLDTMKDDDAAELNRQVDELTGLHERGDTAARKDQLPLMLVLENSPVLCAYGIVRSGSSKPLVGGAAGASGDGPAPTAASAASQGVVPPPYVWQTFGLPDSALPYMLQPFVSAQLHPLLPFGKGDGSAVLNRYGYSPIGLEWDLWLSPDEPADLAAAVVDHGSAGDLVQQAIAMALRCKGVAKSMGRRHNEKAGISPMRWLIDFATSVNQGVMNDANTPVPLYDRAGQAYGAASATAQTFLRLKVESLRLVMPSTLARSGLSSETRPACRVRVVGNTHTHSPVQLRPADFTAGDAAAAAALSGKPADASAGAPRSLFTYAGGAAGAGGASSDGSDADEKKYSTTIYPVEEADLAKSMLVVEVYNPKAPKRVLALCAMPLSELTKGHDGVVTLTAPLQLRKASAADKDAGSQADQGAVVEVAADAAEPASAPGGQRSGGGDGGGGDRGDSAPAPAPAPDQQRMERAGGAGPVGEATEKEPSPFAAAAHKGGDDDEHGDEHGDSFGGSSGGLDLATIARMEAGWEAAQKAKDKVMHGARLDSALGDRLASMGSGDFDFDYAAFEGGLGAEGLGSILVDGTTAVNAASVVLRWETLTVVEAAQQHHDLPPHVGQTCAAMLSAPGGLFLDIKSGYSKAPHLRAFASTLQGIGIHVKAICSFVPKQIAFDEPQRAAKRTKSGKVPQVASTAAELRTEASASKREAVGASEVAAEVVPSVSSAALPSASSASVLVDTAAAPVGVKGRGLPGPGKRTFDTVLFFHGLNGLELACEAGRVPAGTCVLFNGASMVLEDPGAVLTPDSLGDSKDASTRDKKEKDLEELPPLVDREAWRRYCTVVTIFKVFGGIYVQEPDCCPAAVEALIELTNTHAGYLPLGFAYGHLSSKAVAAADHTGRGMAAQQLMEELQSRKALGTKVEKWITQGVHVGASDQVYLSWGRRLLTSSELLYMRGQRLLLRLLADYNCGEGDLRTQGRRLLRLVDGLGGFKFIYLRFFKHYEATSWLTLWEEGWNLNYSKALLRLLRNRGAMLAMSCDDKAAIAKWLMFDPSTRLWQNWVGRGDRHKFDKEAITCLIESCTLAEYDALTAGLGGEAYLWRLLRGWTRVAGWHYRRRILDAKEHWAKEPDVPAIMALHYGLVHYARMLPGGGVAPGQGIEVPEDNGYKSVRRLPRVWTGPDGVPVTRDPTHTRDKTWWEYIWRCLRKCMCCLCTWVLHCWLCNCSFACWCICCLPQLCYPYCRTRIIPLVLAIVFVFFWWLFASAAIATAAAVTSLGGGGQGYGGDYAFPPAPSPPPI